MKYMAKALSLAGFLLAGCSPFSGASQFQCDSNEDCQGALDGRCESTGFCSFLDDACPDGRRYGDLSGPFAGQCVGMQPPIDAIDAPSPEAGEVCFGDAAGFERPCFAMQPATPVTLNAAIDTDGAMCATAVSNTQACVIAGSTVTVPQGATVTVTGTRPLVLVATQTITIAGTL